MGRHVHDPWSMARQDQWARLSSFMVLVRVLAIDLSPELHFNTAQFFKHWIASIVPSLTRGDDCQGLYDRFMVVIVDYLSLILH